jgi:two-component system, chemotaxis family, sensor kinase Cph1
MLRKYLFSFQDTGRGFDMEHAERIFVIFQRLQGREQASGTGIGLALCKKIVERHSGKIWVESKLDQGSTFFFTLPQGPEVG